MIAAVVVLALGYPVVAFFAFRYLQHRDLMERGERSELMQRVQAPEVTVMQHQIQHADPDLPAVDPTDDADFWEGKRMLDEAMMRVTG